MTFLFVLLAATVSVVVMFLITKMVGYRQISELSMYDYINSITLGSIAAELAISSTLNKVIYCLIGMVVYGIFTLLFSIISTKSKRARNFLVGCPITLMEKGKLYRNGLKKSHLDLDEFLSMCRSNGYFDPSKIDTAILEPSGNISIIPIGSDRPVTANDLKISAQTDKISVNLIMDGIVQEKNLKKCGLDDKWLKENLKLQGVKRVEDVFLAVIDSNNSMRIYKK